MNQEIVDMLTLGDPCTLVNEKNLRSKRPTSFTALISSASNGVFTMYEGEVEYIGESEGAQSVNIMMNDREMFRYLYLKEAETREKGTTLGSGVRVGISYTNRPFGFEYCTEWQGTSNYPVRIDGRLFYRQNPLDILDGLYVPPRQLNVVYDATPEQATYEFNEDEEYEWNIGASLEEFLQGADGEDVEAEEPDEPYIAPAETLP